MILRAFQLIFFVSDLALRDIYYVFGRDKAPCQESALRVYAYATSRPPKFYVVSYTNKAGDLETIFDISYLLANIQKAQMYHMLPIWTH